MTYEQQLEAVTAAISSVLRDDLCPETYASGLLDECHSGDGHFEVRRLHTRTGAPCAFWVW